ncbi:Protein of uncharacterised function (DUF3613) [Ralstonia pickettii]|jgi:hypothetical protein|uniref:DUF3613 domain-containing protein n=1 Tax=Ralstonia TaxID=48736 RepID=UPI0001E69F68|nr:MULTISPECIES: DUF3613 domain-containing protein [Ralstonia]EFP68095.1 hypothetical protein HMPREF1004_00117 [Ralstonia pickettii]EGY61503.1 hypothetical protein HMPREF0989_04156 [Ralstonia sp. 5_2_56FAA]KFL22699.1 hypothetical protein DP23_1620 [Ralstonia pickettii]MBU6525330.1 DUF3613 domain-containing protein [Ralstonia sp. B265]NPT50488.1 DUF3613 domain-containing protein [Ralstonia sp. 3N]
MIPRFLMAAGMAVWLMSNPAGAQGFSGGNPQNATQAAPNVGSNMGDATRALLKAQRDGTYAGEFVPLRGEQAALAYQRYLDSFSRPMPGLSQTAPSAKSTSSSQATTAR